MDYPLAGVNISLYLFKYINICSSNTFISLDSCSLNSWRHFRFIFLPLHFSISLKNQQGPFPACHQDIEALPRSHIVSSVSATPLIWLPLSVLFLKMNVSSKILEIAWPWHISFHASNYANLITLNSIPSPWNPIIPQSQMFPLCFIFTCNFDWSLPSLNAYSIHVDSVACKFMVFLGSAISLFRLQMLQCTDISSRCLSRGVRHSSISTANTLGSCPLQTKDHPLPYPK